MKILAIDDEPIFLDILEVALDDLGYDDVTLTTSATAAKEAIGSAERAFDCLLVDIRMPGTDGIELTGWVREIPSYQHTPILMLTKMGERHHVDNAFVAGASDYICKPLDALDLKARLGAAQEVYEQRRSNAELVEQLATSRGPSSRLHFGETIDLAEAERMLSYQAFRNYIQARERTGNTDFALVAFHVSNGRFLHSYLDGAAFVDAMTDVALAIADVLKSFEHQITYCGNGNFCCCATSPSLLDLDEITLQLNLELERYQIFYPYGLLPSISVGRPVRALFPFRKIAVEKAIASAIASRSSGRLAPMLRSA